MNGPATMIYQCPNCQRDVELGEDLISDVVPCPHCKQPFKVEVATATPVSKPEEKVARLQGKAAEAQATVESERTLLVRHPAVFRRNPIQTIIGLLILIGGPIAITWGLIEGNSYFGYGGLIATIIGGGVLAYWWLRSLFVTLTLTTKRTILRHGLISKRTTEVEHDDVRNIQINQGVIPRILNIGDLAISSAGQDTLEIFVRGIAQPEQIVSIIREHQE